MLNLFRVSTTLPRKLAELGVSPALVLRQAGLPPGLFDQEKILVSTEEFFALYRGLAEASGDPAIGLKLGTEDRGVTFQQLTQEARRELARHYLIHSSLELNSDRLSPRLRGRPLLLQGLPRLGGHITRRMARASHRTAKFNARCAGGIASFSKDGVKQGSRMEIIEMVTDEQYMAGSSAD